MVCFGFQFEFGYLHNNVLIIDGTFALCSNLNGFKQTYNWATIFENQTDQIFTYIVVSCLLQNQSKTTYKSMICRINHLYTTYETSPAREENFKPMAIKLDHECAVISYCIERWPDIPIVTCKFHYIQQLRKRFVLIDKNYFLPSSPINNIWLTVKGCPYVPWHESTEEYDLVGLYFTKMNEMANGLSEDIQRKIMEFSIYLRQVYFESSLYGFMRGDHYRYFKHIHSDLTSNPVECQNHIQKDDLTSGKKTVADVAHILRYKKSVAYNAKMFAIKDDNFQVRKKSTRDKWTRQWEVFVRFDQEPLYLQYERLLMPFLLAMGELS